MRRSYLSVSGVIQEGMLSAKQVQVDYQDATSLAEVGGKALLSNRVKLVV